MTYNFDFLGGLPVSKEQESKANREECARLRAAAAENTEALKQYEKEHEELIALRNYVYDLTENADKDTAENSVYDDIEKMKVQIAERNIVIIGGHVNWVNKLKNEFPKWTYLDANISRAGEAVILDSAEKVYFFSDHIAHGTYYKYISSLRERKIPFGYLHTVNLDTNVRQIYRDLHH